MNIDHGSKHLAVGYDQGNISVVDIKGSTLLHQRQITCEISIEDSSVLALDSDTGNQMSTDIVHPKKPYV
ncbi:hypothetical protein K1719_011200 [Acacia pycnantha]|nr:hypothetical protein K1719_011200 [Acacia pycnantha]